MTARRILLIVGIVLLLPVLALGAIILVAQTQWGERWVEARVSAKLDRKVEIGGISFQWGWPPGITLERLKISKRHGFGRSARSQARAGASVARYELRPPWRATGAIPPFEAKTGWIEPLGLSSARAISLEHWPLFQRSQSSVFCSRDNPGRPLFAIRVPPHPKIRSEGVASIG